MTPATFAIETHNGAVWLCLQSERGTDMLAHFCDLAAATRFRDALNVALMAAKAAGEMGL